MNTYLKPIFLLTFLTLSGICTVTLLYLQSEKQMHTRNPFVRRFPHHPIHYIKQLDLIYNSYYFSGADMTHFYLGNVTAPLRLTKISMDLQTQEVDTLVLDSIPEKLTHLKTQVCPPYFYSYNGTYPCMYKGELSTYHAKLLPKLPTTFSTLTTTGIDSFAVRTAITQSQVHTLGTLVFQDEDWQYQWNTKGLSKQIDGIFDTDGILTYAPQLQTTIYLYYYRNLYAYYKNTLIPFTYNHTIDTVSQVRLQLDTLRSGQIKMTSPPPMVNAHCTTYKHYLLVHSKMMGRYEPESMWKNNSIIDVYDLRDYSYHFSFYLQHHSGHYLRDFQVYRNQLFVLSDHNLISYKFKTELFP